MRKGTLVVVDMQTGFAAAHCKATRAAVLREIQRAARLGWGIVVLEVNPDKYESTFAELIAPLNHGACGRWVRKSKMSDSGAFEVQDAINKYEYPHELIRVCGVNIQACVKDTVTQLQQLYGNSRIEIIQDACNSDMPGGWMSFPFGGNIVFLPTGDGSRPLERPKIPKSERNKPQTAPVRERELHKCA